MFSPLEQFEVYSFFNFYLSFFNLSFTNASFFMGFAFFVFFFFSQLVYFNGNGYIVPTRWQGFFEFLYKFCVTLIKDNIGTKGLFFLPFLFSLFVFLLLCNVFGLVPYSYTVTAHFIVTFSLSLLVWTGKLIYGFRKHGFRLLGLLLPGGLPIALVPVFVVVELVSFCIPLVALGVRLFANMMSGHILLKVIVGFCWIILHGSFFLFCAHFIPIFVLFLLLFLETAVAFIQAYVFTMLTSLIIGDVHKGGHLLNFAG